MAIADDLLSAQADYATAMRSRNYVEARHQLVFAQGLISTLPSGAIGSISTQTWRSTDVVKLLAALDRLEQKVDSASSEGCGLTFCEVEYTGTRGGDCGC